MTERHAADAEIESFVYDIKTNAKHCSIDAGEFREFLSPLLEEGRSGDLLDLASCALALSFELSIQTAVIEREHYRALAEMQAAAEEAGFGSERAARHADIGEQSKYRGQTVDRSIGRLL